MSKILNLFINREHKEIGEKSRKLIFKLPWSSIFRSFLSFSMLDYVSNLQEKEGYVENITVDSDCRGKGVGKILLQEADNECRKRQCNVRFSFSSFNFYFFFFFLNTESVVISYFIKFWC